ncbi:hypothetical protein ACJX0J_016541, partial [Zea mays]
HPGFIDVYILAKSYDQHTMKCTERWVKFSDKCTKFFHVATTNRYMNFLRITQLFDTVEHNATLAMHKQLGSGSLAKKNSYQFFTTFRTQQGLRKELLEFLIWKSKTLLF